MADMARFSTLTVEPAPSGRWILSDEESVPLSEHETVNEATRAAQEHGAIAEVTRIVLRDRYGRCHEVAPRGAPRQG